MSQNRIDRLRSEISSLYTLKESLPKRSAAWEHAVGLIKSAESELDRLLGLPKASPSQGKKRSKKAPQKQNNPCGVLVSQLKMAGLLSPLTEHRFHSQRKWRFDLAWPELRLAVEVHGGVYSQGRHVQGEGFTNDREKMNVAQQLGWMILEVTSGQVQSGQALSWIEQALARQETG